jgi:hypothetical protein
MQAKGAGKIVTTARRNHQHRQAKLHKLAKITVDGAIATEEHDDVRLIRSPGHAGAPVDGCVSLERLKAFQRTIQPKDSRSAHVRGRE